MRLGLLLPQEACEQLLATLHSNNCYLRHAIRFREWLLGMTGFLAIPALQTSYCPPAAVLSVP